MLKKTSWMYPIIMAMTMSMSMTVIMVIAVAMLFLTGCGSTQEVSVNDADTTATTQTEEVAADAATEASVEVKEDAVGMENPWLEISEKKAISDCARLFKAPDDSTDQVWMKCEALGDPEKGI